MDDAELGRKVNLLYNRGKEAIENHEFQEAHRIADELAKLRNTGAWEIRARAHWEAGETEEAIETLQRGTQGFPYVAILWSYLGEFLSEEGRYDEAIAAFRKSALGHGGSVSLSHYNIALCLWRKGSYEEAEEELDLVKQEPPPAHLVLDLQACIALDTGRPQLALDILEQLHEAHPKQTTRHEFAHIMGMYAEAYLELGDREQAEYFAREAIEFDKSESRATRTLRLLKGRTSPNSRLYRVQIQGSRHEEIEGEPAGFFATYDVVAENEQQLLDEIRPFEPKEVRESLVISEITPLERMPDEPMGVLRAWGGYTFFSV